jgi:hypothetical protein
MTTSDAKPEKTLEARFEERFVSQISLNVAIYSALVDAYAMLGTNLPRLDDASKSQFERMSKSIDRISDLLDQQLGK